MREAIQVSIENIKSGGGPFGAVIVRSGEIVAKAGNSVTTSNDPTAHAEVNVIRLASNKLNTFDLSDCVIYTSCEPCPMCLGAIYWAKMKKIYFANQKEDAAAIDFDDNFIYKEIDLPYAERSVFTKQLLRDEALKAFEIWENKIDKKLY